MNGAKLRLACGKGIGLSEAWQLSYMEMKSILSFLQSVYTIKNITVRCVSF